MFTLTDIAVRCALHKMATRGVQSLGIRIGVKPSGCTGFAYVLEYVDELLWNDKCFYFGDLMVVVDREHLRTLNGLTIDYAREGLNEGFRFRNANTITCGCGESFRVQDAKEDTD